MRTCISWLLALCVLFTCIGCAEGAPASAGANQEELIFAQTDDMTGPGLVISGQGEDGNNISRRIIGVVSEPAPCAYSAFDSSYQNILRTVFGTESKLSDCAYSDGAWARVASLGDCCVVVYTTGVDANDDVIQVAVTGDADSAIIVFALSAACMISAGNVGQMGTSAMYALMMGTEPESYFAQPIDIWLENGFQLSCGTDEQGVLYGKITYTQDMPVKGGYSPLDPAGLIALTNNLTFKQLSERIAVSGRMFGLSAPTLPAEYDIVNATRVYRFYWDDCAVMLSASDTDEPSIWHISLASASGDTTSLWTRAMLLYNAAIDATITDFGWLASLAGSGGGWQRLSEMSPYVVYRDAMLTCMTSGDMLCAFITGAEAK